MFDMMPIRTGLPLRGITTFRTRGRPGLIDGGVAVPLVVGDGAGCPPGPGRDRLHGWGQLWCIRRVPGLHVVVQDEAVVVVDSLPLYPNSTGSRAGLRDRAGPAGRAG